MEAVRNLLDSRMAVRRSQVRYWPRLSFLIGWEPLLLPAHAPVDLKPNGKVKDSELWAALRYVERFDPTFCLGFLCRLGLEASSSTNTISESPAADNKNLDGGLAQSCITFLRWTPSTPSLNIDFVFPARHGGFFAKPYPPNIKCGVERGNPRTP